MLKDERWHIFNKGGWMLRCIKFYYYKILLGHFLTVTSHVSCGLQNNCQPLDILFLPINVIVRGATFVSDLVEWTVEILKNIKCFIVCPSFQFIK